jgi:hypothetical protein
VYNVAAEQYGLDPVDIKTIYETIKAKKNTGRNAAANKIAKEFVTLKTPKNVLDLFNTIDESISKIEQEDANVGKPTVAAGSKSGPPATKPRVGDGIGPDATQGTAEPKTPAAPGLGATVSDTSTDNVPEGSQSAALGLFENMGENGALMEYPEVAASLNKYVQDIDFAALDVATKSEEYAQYKATMASNLAAAYPSGEIPVTRTEGYADPKAEKTKRNFTVRTEDVAFVGNVDEQELIIRTPEGKLQSVRIGTAPSIEEAKIAAAAAQAAAKLEGSQSAALLTPAAEELLAAAELGAPSRLAILAMFQIATENGIEILPTDTPTMVIDKLKAKKQAVESLTAARRAEKVAVDLKVAAEREAAAKLKDAQLPSIDEGLPETPVSTSEQARVQRTATKAKMETAQAEREAAGLAQRQQAAQQAEALRTENAAQYRQGEVPLSLVPAKYNPKAGDLGMGKEGAARQVIPASITVSQAPPPVYKPEYISAKFWTDTFGLRSKSKMFEALAGEEISSSTVRDTLAKYAGTKGQSAAKTKIKAWLDKTAIKYTATPPDERSSEGLAAKAKFTAANRKKLDAANLAAQQKKDDLFNPEFAELSVEDPYLNDVSTPSDKQKATFVAYGEFKGEAPAEPVMYLTGRVSKDRQGKERAEEKKVIMLPHTAAGKYFERYKRIPDALNAIASDYTGDINAYKTDDQVSPAENTFFVGTGRIPATAARAWVDANMSEAVREQLSSLISKAKTSYLAASDAVAIGLKTIYEGNVPLRENAIKSAAANMKREDAEVETNAAIANVVKSMSATVVGLGKKIERIPVPKGDPFAALFASANKNKENLRKPLDENVIVNPAITGLTLPSNAVLDLEGNMHPAVNGGLLTNNLAQALRALGRTGRNSAIRRISTRFSRLVGNTQVQVVEALRGQDGTAAAGVFDPSTNTIYLDSVTGLNPHVVIHEMSHALTSAELANPQSPLRQRVSELFNKALPYMGSIQGSANLDEFAAESMSNHMFREEMARIHPNGNPMSTWQLFSNSVKNFLRRLIGLDPKAYGMLSEIDQVLDAILAPAPQFRDAGQLYMNSLPNGVSPIYRGVFKILNGAPGNLQNNESLVGGLATAFRALTKIPREILIGLNTASI